MMLVEKFLVECLQPFAAKRCRSLQHHDKSENTVHYAVSSQTCLIDIVGRLHQLVKQLGRNY